MHVARSLLNWSGASLSGGHESLDLRPLVHDGVLDEERVDVERAAPQPEVRCCEREADSDPAVAAAKALALRIEPEGDDRAEQRCSGKRYGHGSGLMLWSVRAADDTPCPIGLRTWS